MRVRDIYHEVQERNRKTEEAWKRLSMQSPFQPILTQENRLTTLDVYPEDVTPRKVLVPYPFKSEPKTVHDALRRGRKVLEDEARWVKGSEHVINGNSACSIDSKQGDDPFCGSWTACARGAVSLVTRGLVQQGTYGHKIFWKAADTSDFAFLKKDKKAQRAQALYEAAEKALDLAVVARNGHNNVVQLNDDSATTRTEVLAIFDTAIKMMATHGNDFVSHVTAGGLRAA